MSAPLYETVSLNNPITYTLPATYDVESDPITINTYTTGGTTLPSFITFSGSTYTINPTAFTDVGYYDITVDLVETYTTNTYTFGVTVTNSVPYFTGTFIVNLTAPLNAVTNYQLPSCLDDEHNPITVITNQ